MTTFIEWCARLIRDAAGIRMILTEANIDPANVHWDGTPRAIWASVLNEERNQDKLGAVFRALLTHYPDNDEFLQAGVQYLQQAHSRHASTLGDLADGTSHVASLVERTHDELAILRNELRAVKDEVADVRLMLKDSVWTPQRRWAWLLGYLIFALPMFLFFKDVRDQLSMTWQLAFGLVLSTWLISLLPFMYWMGLFRDT